MSKLTVQEMILTLQKFWSDNGCMLMQAYDTEKRSRNHESVYFLRAVDRSAWNAAYVDPSRRPADGRYGENPNRLYQHHQVSSGDEALSRKYSKNYALKVCVC